MSAPYNYGSDPGQSQGSTGPAWAPINDGGSRRRPGYTGPPPPPYSDLFGDEITPFTVPFDPSVNGTGYYYKTGDGPPGPPPGALEFEAFLASLPYDPEGINAIQGAYDRLVNDYLTRVRLAQAGGAPLDQIPSWADYLARLDIDTLLYNVSPTSYFNNKLAGVTGLTPEERAILAQNADMLLSLYGPNVAFTSEMATAVDPRYALGRYASSAGLTLEEQQRLQQLYGALLNEAPDTLGGMAQWLSGQPARQLLLTYDPRYALDSYLASSGLSADQQQAVRASYDALLSSWRASGEPGSFYGWLQRQGSPSALAESSNPEMAYQAWMSRQPGMTSEGQSRLNRSFDRIYAQYLEQGSRGSFRDYLRGVNYGDAALGQAPADLSGLVGRSRWLGF